MISQHLKICFKKINLLIMCLQRPLLVGRLFVEPYIDPVKYVNHCDALKDISKEIR